MRAQRFRFLTAIVFLFAASGYPQPREIAVTFDDLPAVRAGDLAQTRAMTRRLLASLARAKVPAIGFVNESKLHVAGELDARVALLAQWLDAGHELGNHTYSHVFIDQVSFDDYKRDLIRGEEVTRKLLSDRGATLRYFRHPQLRTGPTVEYKRALDALLAERGYTVAPVTIDSDEFVFAFVYERAKKSGDRRMAKRVAGAYLEYMERVVEHFERLSLDFLGYEVKQILLLHANELNADHLDALLAMLQRRGYRFITLGDALKDYAYRAPDPPVDRGLSWIHRWMAAKGLPVRLEPQAPEFVKEAAGR